MFQKGDVLKLADNNEYAVVDKFEDNGTTYIYLVDINNNTNIMFGKLENDEVIELTDVDEIEKVIKIVNDNLHNDLNNIQ